MFKNFKVTIATLVFSLVFIVSQSSPVAAISVKELLGLEKSEAELRDDEDSTKVKKDAKKGDWSKTTGENAPSILQINMDYVSLLVANMSQQEREKVLEDPQVFKQVIENEAINRSIISAAITNKVEQDRNVNFLMRRSAENILREAYLNRLIVSKLPNDFPSDEQITEYYETNKDKFVIPERVHVWQVFFMKPEGIDKNEVTKLKKKASQIISDIKKGKSDFSNVAIAQSEHEQSKALGGYMGLLKTSELLPEMKESILKLKENEISNPVESETGIHILKRGKVIKAENLELSQVKPQIGQLLIKEANIQLRQAIFTQASKEYPQNISDKKLEEWRLRLKTNTN
jgi:parvulin-like peptidyl-prolyl isomerase